MVDSRSRKLLKSAEGPGFVPGERDAKSEEIENASPLSQPRESRNQNNERERGNSLKKWKRKQT